MIHSIKNFPACVFYWNRNQGPMIKMLEYNALLESRLADLTVLQSHRSGISF
jgi:hypothetical protein